MNLFETSRQVTVLGAGMVGVSCALALQAKGWRVTLVDQQAPGEKLRMAMRVCFRAVLCCHSIGLGCGQACPPCCSGLGLN
jgi:flavin-dependent dehydrogenase